MKIGEGAEIIGKIKIFYLFDLKIDVAKRSVSRGESTIDLPPLSWNLLQTLCSQSETAHSQSELENALWPNQVVGTDVLKQRVLLLRKALGKTPEGGDYIVTDRNKGYRLAEAVTEKPVHTMRKVSKRTGTLFAVLMMAAIAIFASYYPFEKIGSLTVRVAPFTTSNELGEMSEAFATGLSLELAGRIASLPKLVAVVPTDGQGVGSEDVVLVGQIARNDERIHVVTTLYDAETNEVIWGQTYDRKFEDIFEVQRDIVLHISFILHDEIDPESSERLKTGPTNNYVAYGLFVQAVGLKGSDKEAAQTLLDRALGLDPSFEAAKTLKAEISKS